jgi:hypothetical protein
MKRNADRHRRAMAYAVGDAVMLSTEHLRIVDPKHNRKLAHLQCGPFPIKAVINDNAYELELPEAMRIHAVVNISHLQPYRDGRVDFPDRPMALARPPPEAADPATGAAEYEVERVLAQRGKGRTASYLILWKGYPYHDATWEKAANVVRAQGALDEFRELQKLLRRPQPRSRRGAPDHS